MSAVAKMTVAFNPSGTSARNTPGTASQSSAIQHSSRFIACLAEILDRSLPGGKDATGWRRVSPVGPGSHQQPVDRESCGRS